MQRLWRQSSCSVLGRPGSGKGAVGGVSARTSCPCWGPMNAKGLAVRRPRRPIASRRRPPAGRERRRPGRPLFPRRRGSAVPNPPGLVRPGRALRGRICWSGADPSQRPALWRRSRAEPLARQRAARPRAKAHCDCLPSPRRRSLRAPRGAARPGPRPAFGRP